MDSADEMQRNVLKMKANTCEGCLVVNNCVYGNSKAIRGCPCKSCLVKMVCETTCKDFNKTLKTAQEQDKNES